MLQGETISAKEADYYDYKELLKCPHCKEIVFLRKKHIRGKTHVSAAFIHHKSVDPSSCEYRVNKYTQKEVNAINAGAKQQRLALLKKFFLSIIKDYEVFRQREYIMKVFKENNSKVFSLLFNTFKTALNSYKGRKLWLENVRTESSTMINGYRVSVEKDGSVGKEKALSYHDKRNVKIGLEILEFCLTSQGKDLLISIIPELIYMSCTLIRQLTSSDSISYTQVLEIIPTILFNLFTLNIDWITSFDKAENGEYECWELGKPNNKENKKKKQ
jgi:uncharacterized C2H2 Zn-finger protein